MIIGTPKLEMFKAKIKHIKPWFFFIIKYYFPYADFNRQNRGTVVVFNQTIYTKDPLSAPLYAHEIIHCEQQKNFWGAIKWWKQYLKDPKFRYEQELESYQMQYKVYCGMENDKEKRNRYLVFLAGILSGPLYKYCISFSQAEMKIKKGNG